MKPNCRIGFIGTGNMAQAILFGMVNKKLIAGKDIYGFDIAQGTLAQVKERAGINAMASNEEVIKNSDIIFLAVKPVYCESVLKEIGNNLKNKALLSIVSGWSFQDIKKYVPDSCRILIVQPNTPLLVGAGMTSIAKTTDFTNEELETAKEIFSSQGLVESVPDELLMFCGTSCGAAPAFTYLFIEALTDAAVRDGIPRATAYKMSAQAVIGAGKMVLETGLHPGDLKDKITSPGGSTIRGIHALERGGMRGAVMDAVKECNDRWR